MASKFFDEYIKMRISTIRSFDRYVHVMMESYAKMLSQFNKTCMENEPKNKYVIGDVKNG